MGVKKKEAAFKDTSSNIASHRLPLPPPLFSFPPSYKLHLQTQKSHAEHFHLDPDDAEALKNKSVKHSSVS